MKKVLIAASIATLLSGCAMPGAANRPLKSALEDGSVAPVSVPAAAPAYTPTPSDFRLEVIELEKKCFGSAGCHVTYLVDPAYGGPALDSSQSYTVIYQLVGGDATETGSFTVQGDQYAKPDEERISTPSEGASGPPRRP